MVSLSVVLAATLLVAVEAPVWAVGESGLGSVVPPIVSPAAASGATTMLDEPVVTSHSAAGAVPAIPSLPGHPPLQGFVEGESWELPALRTARSTVYANPDGTRTLKASTRKRYYQAASGLVPVDDTVVAGSVPGTLRNRANSWSVEFAPLPAGLTITSPDGVLTGSPVGSAVVSPVIGSDGTSVVYAEAWPGVDLRYRVEPDRVKEEIVVKTASAPSRFEFATNVGFGSDPTVPGGLVPAGPMAGAWRVAPVEVVDNDGRRLPGSGAVMDHADASSTSPMLAVSVDGSWLASRPASAFPIVIDPTFYEVGSNDSLGFTSDFAPPCSPCQVRTGNEYDGDSNLYWRTGVHFPYNDLAGSRILDATVALGGEMVGTGYHTVHMRQTNSPPTSWLDVGQYIDGVLSDDVAVLDDPAVAAFYQGRVNAGDFGAWVMFLGDEDNANFTYQERWGFELQATYTRPPSVTLSQPPNGASFHTLSPTLEAVASDPDGDETERIFEVYADAGLTQLVYSYGLVEPGGLVVPDGTLQSGHTYYWRVRVHDAWDWGATSPVWSFTPTNAAPPKPTPAGPANQAILKTSSLHFATNAVTDPDNDGVQYQFQVTTGSSGDTGLVTVSPWSASTSWDPPAGTFADGGTYYWSVKARDVYGAEGPRSDVRSFKVDFRLGQRSSFPYDSLGGAAVNLSNGNLVVGASGPSFSTLGGPVGLSLSYNSQAPRLQGLYGDYYQDTNTNQVLDAGDTKIIRRLDPQLNFAWPGSPIDGVVPPDGFVVNWSGYLTKPASEAATQWVLEGEADDRVRIDVGGATVLDKPCCGAFTSSSFTLSSTGPKALQVTLADATSDAYLHLKIRRASDPAGSGSIVPSDWLSPTGSSLPYGWARAGDSFLEASYTALRATNSGTTVLVDDSGADHPFTWTGSAWKPPANDDGVLTKNDDNTWTLLAEDGYLYRFDRDGRLVELVSSADDLHPGAPRYLYSTVAGRTRLDEVNDASNRSIYFKYGPERDANGNPIGTDPCPSAGGYQPAPSGMLCKVLYAGFQAGASTDIYYSNGQLARLVNPGSEITDYGYDANGRMTAIRDPLTNDLIAAATFGDPTSATHQTIITYDNANRVTSVTSPAASSAMTVLDHPRHNYDYTDGTITKVHVAGLTPFGGPARTVTIDAEGHTTQDVDAAGVTTQHTWDSINDRITRTDAAGSVSAFVYDHAGRLTDTYGPGSAHEVDNRLSTAPRNTTGYDEGIRGLAAAYWTNATLTGAPKLHATGVGSATGIGSSTGELDVYWQSGGPPGLVDGTGNAVVDNWSARFTGEILFPTAGTYVLRAYSDDGARVFVDDQLVSEAWSEHGPAYSPAGNVVVAAANTRKRVRVDYFESGGGANLALLWSRPGQAEQVIPGAYLAPRYGLATSVTDNGERTVTEYARPEIGLPTATVVDPGGLNLRTTVDHESPAPGSFFRRTRKGLPKGPGLQDSMLRDGPTGLWRLDESGGAIAHPAGAGPKGTFQGPTHPVAGRTVDHPASSFDGINDRVLLPTIPADSRGTGLTFEADVNVTLDTRPSTLDGPIEQAATRSRPSWGPSSTVYHVVGAYPFVGFSLQNYGGPDFHVAAWNGSEAGTAGTIRPGEWAHIAVVYAPDSNARTIFVNGEMVGVDTTGPAVIDRTNEMRIGEDSRWGGYDTGLLGKIKDVAIYPTALPATTIQRHAQAAAAQDRGNLSTYYGANEAPTSAAGSCSGTVGVNQAGALKTQTGPDPDGPGSQTPIVREYRYDAAGRTIATRVVGDSSWACTTYDDRGRVVSSRDRLGNLTTNSYAVPGTVTTNYTDMSGTSRSTVAKSDWIGRAVWYRDEHGTVSESTYDKANQVTATYRTIPGEARAQLTALEHADGRLYRLRDYLSSWGGLGTDFTYDAAGRLEKTGRPGNVLTVATYDPGRGRLTGLANRQGNIWLGGSDLSAGSSFTYGHNTEGQITSEVSSTRSRTFTYDAADRLTRTVDGSTTRNYAYDANTNRCAVAVACDGSYSYDNADRLTSSPLATGHTYDSHGNLVAADRRSQPPANSLSTGFSYSGPLQHFDYPIVAGQAGPLTANLSWSSSLAPIPSIVTLALKDAAGNVVAEDGPANPTTANTRSLSATVPAGAYTLVVTAIAGTGTGTLSATWPNYAAIERYIYDGNDHAISINDGHYVTWETLSPTGRVIRRVVRDSATNQVLEDTSYGYDGPGDSPSYSRPTAGGPTTGYLTGPSGLLAIYTPGTATYPMHNAHGDIIGTTDINGTFTATPTFDEFGVGNPGPGRLGWLGQHERFTTGAGLGLVRMGVRLYDPNLGRFLSVDPIEGGSANDYDYVSGDAVNGLDLDGRCMETPAQRLHTVRCTPSTRAEFAAAREARARAAAQTARDRAAAARAKLEQQRRAARNRCGRGTVVLYELIGFIAPKGSPQYTAPGLPTFGQQLCIALNYPGVSTRYMA